MGNETQYLSENITLIASPDTWIEGEAVRQLRQTAKLPGMAAAAGMSDLHAGRDSPIGAAFFSIGTVYPALVGADIGCGMSLWQTDIRRNTNRERLVKKIGNIDAPLTAEQAALLLPGHHMLPETQGYAPGTIGGGNHFAELLVAEHIEDEKTAMKAGVNADSMMLLVHSGSRGLGGEILQGHVAAFGHAGLPDPSEALAVYLKRHNAALRFAEQNRLLIAKRLLSNLKAEGKLCADIFHNFVEPASMNGKTGWLHRKSAAPADRGPAIIPGSRGSHSYLVDPVCNAVSLFSLAHGAGRKWKRSDCKDRLQKRFSAKQLEHTALGSRVICADRALIFEEAPQAYKSIETVIASLVDAGLIRIVAKLKPVLTYKKQKEASL